MTSSPATPIKLPARCAWCGNDTKLSLQPIKFNQNEVTGFYLVAYRMRFQTFKFSLPICEECKNALERNRKRMILASVLGGLLGGGVILLYLLISNSLDYWSCAMGLPLGVTAGIFLGIVIGTILFRQKSWGTVQNGKLRFQNYQFQNEFNWLNSHLR
jgi:hypothetical protein